MTVEVKSMARDKRTKMEKKKKSAGKYDRRFYLVGPRKGQPRPSRRTRARRREQRVTDGRRAGASVVREIVEQLKEEELAKAVSEAGVLGQNVVKYRLIGGYRLDKHGQTWYSMEEEAQWLGQLVVLNEDDVVSGRRWFREEYPELWMEEYTMKGCEWQASRSLGDYGRQFVEYEGSWYEAEKVG